MSYSDLTNVYIPSPNHSGTRQNYVSKITIHHMAGNLSVESCGGVFQNTAREASSNYGIGSDGRIGCYVDEENRAWTSASWWNDNQAITIEVANNEIGGDWGISDAAYNALIALCADICNRYGINPYYDGTIYAPLTEHMMFASTNCPGPTIHALLANGTIENDIRAAMNGGYSPSAPTPSAPSADVSGDVEDLARRTIAGEFGNGDQRRAALGSRYDEVQARINEIYGGVTQSSAPSYSIDDIANRVIAGEFGNGSDRIANLAAAGYDNVAVQNRVNEILGGGSTAPAPQSDLGPVIDAVLRGEYGNGPDRASALAAAGYDYNEVQAAVNARLGAGTGTVSYDSEISVGDTVVVTNPIIYGTDSTFAVNYSYYTVMEVVGDRAVIGVDGVVTSAIATYNLRKA